MMDAMNRSIKGLILTLLLFSVGLAQPKNRDRQISLDCVTCHVGWHDLSKGGTSLLPQIDAPIQIEGLPAHIPTAAMCYSCHDGTINDSREVFSSNNHQLGMNLKGVDVKKLPLDKNGKVYCGTCHTPHSLKPSKKGGLAPFLRQEKLNSELCLSCHSSQAQNHLNHPIKVKPMANHTMPESSFWGKDGTMECMTCHPIHGAQAAVGVNGNDRSELCSACHENYFKIRNSDHDLTVSLKRGAGTIGPNFEERDPCSACHVSHNGKGAAMWSMELDPKLGENGYCLGCHSSDGLGRQKSFTHQGHPVKGIKILKDRPQLGIKAGDEMKCISCHDPHQWDFEMKHTLTTKNEEGTEYTSFLHLPDDAQGQLCIVCHKGQSTMFESDHSVSREGFQQYFREANTLHGQCTVCHGTHENDLGGQTVDDPYTILCMRCHDGERYPTSVVHNNHPMGIPFKSKSGLKGYQKAGQTLLSCNTCHDPHKWGKSVNASTTVDLKGDDRNSFLTMSNYPKPTLCLDCHGEQGTILGTDHDLTTEGSNACSQCHSPHNAESEYGLLSEWGGAPGESFNEKHCFSCHNASGIASDKLVTGYTHPREFGTLTPPARGLGPWLDFPLFTKDGPSKTVGHIDCFTCHDPHKWSYRKDLQTPGKNAEGNDLTSFLRNPSQRTLCTDCHGENTLWKYNYYHDPVKRKRY
jgi:predicted CXXCH cytochrome family protein